jgi:type I restriction enzyme M protein
MLLHGIDVPSQIEHDNTLGIGWNDWSTHDKVDCVITNPPFGGYEDDGIGSDYPATCAPAKRPTCSWPSSSRSC